MADTETAKYHEIETETDNAYLINFDASRVIWMPKSQVEVDTDNKEVYMPRWLYEQHFI